MRKTKNKCVECKNKLFIFQIKCIKCNKFVHKKCVSNKNGDFICTFCSNKSLPFNNINNSEFLSSIGKCASNLPSFRIQSLIDSFNKDKNEDFISETVNSRYYSETEFIDKQFDKKSFAVLHLNIASLALHLDELKILLAKLNIEFDIITLTEIKHKITKTNIKIMN